MARSGDTAPFLSLLDVTLTLCGNRLSDRLFGSQRLASLVTSMTRLLQVLAVVYFAYENVSFFASGSDVTADDVSDIIMTSISSCMVAVVAVRRLPMKRLMRQLVVSQATEQLIKRKCRWFLLMYVIGLITDVSATILGYMTENAWTAVKRTLFLLPLLMNQFITVYPAFYLSVWQLLSDHEMMQMKFMCNSDATANDMMARRRKVMKLKEQFESLFNFVPLVMFLLPFTTIPGMVADVSVNRGAQSVYYSFSYAATHTWMIIFIVLIVKQARDSHQQASQATANLISIIQQKYAGRLHETSMQSLIDQLRIDQEFKLTGSSLFVVDTQLIPSFCSSLVTMSVLVIQLWPKTRHGKDEMSYCVPSNGTTS